MQGKTLVLTRSAVGTNLKEHVISRVPMGVRFSIELRADRAEFLRAFHGILREGVQRVADERDVASHLIIQSSICPVRWIRAGLSNWKKSVKR